MIFIIAKTMLAALVITLVSWLSGKKTSLAGFLTALPLTTLLALAFSHAEWGNTKQSVDFAKSIFVAIPVSLLFFVPFLFAERLNLGFWSCYTSGVALLAIGYFAHDLVVRLI